MCLIQLKDTQLNKLYSIHTLKISMILLNKSNTKEWLKFLSMIIQNTQLKTTVKHFTNKSQITNILKRKIWICLSYLLKIATIKKRRILLIANQNTNKNIDKKEIILNIVECKKFVWNRWREIHHKKRDRPVNKILCNSDKIEQVKASKKITG